MNRGVRRIDAIDGGVIAWLYGETDLDAVLLVLAAHLETLDDSWTERGWREPDGVPEPVVPTAPLTDPAWNVWDTEWAAYRSAGDYGIVEDHPTGFVFHGAPREVEVGWFRRFPWCNCGEDHAWHYEQSNPGRGASLAVLVSWYS